jgi:hypothetical protein
VDRLRKRLAKGHRVVIAVGAAVDSHNDDHRDAARVAEVYELHDGRAIETWVGRALHRAVAAIVADSGK